MAFVMWRMYCEKKRHPMSLRELEVILSGNISLNLNELKWTAPYNPICAHMYLAFFRECICSVRSWRMQKTIRFDTRQIRGRHMPFWF